MRCIDSDSSNCVRLGVLAASDDNSSGNAYAMGEMVTGEMVTSETRAIKSRRHVSKGDIHASTAVLRVILMHRG